MVSVLRYHTELEYESALVGFFRAKRVVSMESKDPLTEELGCYENQWVAILESERRIVGSGDTAVEAKQEAKTRGYSEIALFKVPAAGKLYAYPA